MSNGENTRPKMKRQPVGPNRYLVHGVLALGLILSISASHFDWYSRALISSNLSQ